MNCKHGWQPMQQLEIEAKVNITGLQIRVDNLLYEVRIPSFEDNWSPTPPHNAIYIQPLCFRNRTRAVSVSETPEQAWSCGTLWTDWTSRAHVSVGFRSAKNPAYYFPERYHQLLFFGMKPLEAHTHCATLFKQSCDIVLTILVAKRTAQILSAGKDVRPSIRNFFMSKTRA